MASPLASLPAIFLVILATWPARWPNLHAPKQYHGNHNRAGIHHGSPLCQQTLMLMVVSWTRSSRRRRHRWKGRSWCRMQRNLRDFPVARFKNSCDTPVLESTVQLVSH